MTIQKVISFLSSKRFFYVSLCILATTLVFALLRLSNAPLQDNDEGIYTTTFLLVAKGHPLYTQTFFSQPPVFFLSLYPVFLFFGKTLIAARLAIGLWTLIGVSAIVWIGYELKKPLLGFLAIGILFLIPFATHQFFIFQSDILVSVFSLKSFAALCRFYNTIRLRWLVLATFWCVLAFWAKLSFFLVLPILSVVFLLYKTKKVSRRETGKAILVCTGVAIITSLAIVLPFGIGSVIKNTLGLRLAASSVTSGNLYTYLTQNVILFTVVISALVLCLREKKWFSFPLLPLVLWNGTIILTFSVYHPFFPHHMSMVVFPIVLLWAVLVTKFLEKRSKLYLFAVFSILLIGTLYYLSSVLKTPQGLLNIEQKQVVQLIQKNSSQEDTIVTDDQILYSASNRLPPPELSDISQIRVSSHNLSPQEFKKLLDTYQPTLILPRTGRLTSLENFQELLSDYDVFSQMGDKTIYIRKSKAYVRLPPLTDVATNLLRPAHY